MANPQPNRASIHSKVASAARPSPTARLLRTVVKRPANFDPRPKQGRYIHSISNENEPSLSRSLIGLRRVLRCIETSDRR